MGPKLSGIKAIYFDLDDTLCAYWDAARQGLRRTFDDHPLGGRTAAQLIEVWGEEFAGFSKEIGTDKWYPRYCESGEQTRFELMRRVLVRLGMDDEDMAEALSGTYYVERHAALELFPEALGVLRALRGLYPLGLITNGPADIQRQEIEKLQIAEFFGPILIEGEMRVGKPDPRVMERAEKEIGASGREILMVGNSFKHDMVPAMAAGWQTAWVRRASDVPPSSKTGRPEDRPADSPAPDLEITSLVQLTAALGLTLQPR